MDPDGTESSVLYKQLVDEKSDTLKGKDQKEVLPEGKEKMSAWPIRRPCAT